MTWTLVKASAEAKFICPNTGEQVTMPLTSYYNVVDEGGYGLRGTYHARPCVVVECPECKKKHELEIEV